MIFVAEVEGRAICGTDAEDVTEARDFLLPAVEEVQRRMFELQMEYRLAEAAPVITRPASADELAIWRMSVAKKMRSSSSVVWFFPMP